MKLFFRLSFTAIILTLFSGVFVATKTQASNPLPEILNRMEINRSSMKTLRSKVTMVKYNAQLKESDTSEGTSIYMPTKGRDALVRIDWTKPVEETLAVVNGKYVLYRPRLKQAITGNAKDAKGSGKANNALSFMSMSKEQLKANYTIKYLGEEKVSGGVPTWRLELTPKKATSFKMAELWVDGNGMPIQAKIVEGNNDTTTVLLSGFEKNAKINVSQFEVKLPKGTAIVE
ncbi:MAG: outer membrane lipoprotein carrier protein LolA [Acidobacteria bacterium]|jgi:outer membrane lipoprotein-sorting protein|nr:outer membrane lipoprotein carrier protein LolA [Acidobacteriota bacterium]